MRGQTLRRAESAARLRRGLPLRVLCHGHMGRGFEGDSGCIGLPLAVPASLASATVTAQAANSDAEAKPV